MLAQRRRRWPNIISQLNQQGFRQVCLGGGVPKGWESGGPPRRKKSKNFECLKWPILTEMTAKPGIYCHFSLPTRRGGYPPCGAERGGPDPPNC